MHLKSSTENTLQFEALKTQELNPDKSPRGQLVLKLTNSVTKTNTQNAQTGTASKPIWVNKIIKQAKEDYLEHLDFGTHQNTIQSRMNFNLTLKRECKLAAHLLSVRDMKEQQILTNYRFSDHGLAVETGRP